MTRAIFLLGLLGGSPGCSPPPYDSATGDSSAGAPSIRISFPESSTEYTYCSTFMVSVDVENFVLSEEHYGGDNVEGEGHWHLLDGDEVLKATADEWAFIPEEKALADGDHVLKAQLVKNDHQALDPEISWIAEITVNNAAIDDTGTEDYEGCLGGGGSGAGY